MPNDLGASIGRMIRTERERRGWSRAVLEEESGLGYGVLGHFETGKRIPNHYSLARLYRVFGVMFLVDVMGLLADATELSDVGEPGEPGDQQADWQATVVG